MRAGEAGVRVLRLRCWASPAPDPPRVRFPVVVKPLRAGSHGPAESIYRKRERARRSLWPRSPNGAGIVQAYLEGRPAQRERRRRGRRGGRRRPQEALRTWRADCGPVSYAQTIELDPRVHERAAALMAALRLERDFNLQFIESEAGLFLVDVNPRLHASIGWAVAAGVDLPAIWVETLLGRSRGSIRTAWASIRSGATCAR